MDPVYHYIHLQILVYLSVCMHDDDLNRTFVIVKFSAVELYCKRTQHNRLGFECAARTEPSSITQTSRLTITITFTV